MRVRIAMEANAERYRTSPPAHSAWATSCGAACALALVSLTAACDSEWNRQRDAPPRIDPSAAPGPANTPMPAGAQAESNARPSIEDNMGRGFQGALELALRAASGKQHRVRFLSRGDDARLEVDDVGGDADLDALIWGENISIIDNRAKTYRTTALATAPKTTGDDRVVRVEPTGERKLIDGVGCERYEIIDGDTRISAWVTALAGTFAVDALEAVGGVDVPAWAEQLLDQQRMPLQAAARDASGRELYTLELIRYTPGPVDESMVSLPTTYRPATTVQVSR